jgi:hypothetical protein
MYYANNSLFISVCFERSSPTEEPNGLCQGSSPNLICSHVPMEIFLFYEMRKNGGNKNWVVSTRGGSCTPVFSWGSGTLSCSHPWVPLPKENTLIREPPLQQYSNSTLSFMRSMTKLLHSSNSKIQNLNTYPQFIMGDNSACWKPWQTSLKKKK